MLPIRKRLLHTLLALSLTVAGSSAGLADEATDIECPEDAVCRQVGTGLPLRALPRALSKIYAAPADDAKVLYSNVKAFYPVFVFAREGVDFSDPANPKGWYRIGFGAKTSDILGWMSARDILEWKQALVVAYSHPGTGEERRNPVMMFSELDQLQILAEAEDRASRAKADYDGLEAEPMRVPDGVVTTEPMRFIDIDEVFYILPVIAHQEADIFEDETKYLRIAAAIPGKRADEASPDTLQSEKYAQQALADESTQGTQARTLGLDIVFVMDVTGSMQPYVDATKDAITRVATQIGSIDAEVRFGLIGFKDDVHDYTPKLVDGKEFVRLISEVIADGGGDNQEEVYAGVVKGIQANWGRNTYKFIVVVGDYSSHDPGNPLSLTKMDAEQIRGMADDTKVSVMVLHLKADRSRADHPRAERQFRTLARNAGAQLEGYLAVDADNVDDFRSVVKTLAEQLSVAVEGVRKGDTGITREDFESTYAESGAALVDRAGDVARSLVAAQTVRYVGKAATPPKDITAWVMDRDLVDIDKKALDVRVLLSRRELDDLIRALDDVLKAFKRSKLTSSQFFDALQAVVATGAKGEKVDFERAKDLADVGLLPSWIASLPYKSRILNLNSESYDELSPDQKAALEQRIENLLTYYHELSEDTDSWHALDERDAATDNVHPLSLGMLP